MKQPIQVCSFEGISTVLGEGGFQPVEYGARHKMLGEALNFDVFEILRAINAIPLCLRDEDHARTRKRIAKRIADAEPAFRRFIQNELPVLLDQLLAPGAHDVMEEFVFPCVDKLIQSSIGVAPETGADSMVSRLFSQSIGVSKRRRMNAELGALRKRLEAKFPLYDAEDIDDCVALAVLGTDALRGTLGCSLHAIFTSDRPQVAQQNYAKVPPCTGVPYVDREAMGPCHVEDVSYGANTFFQGRLNALEHGTEKERLRFWGFGSHTCLGRRMSLQSWALIAARIRAANPDVDVVSYGLRKDDVFAVPERFEIEVSYA